MMQIPQQDYAPSTKPRAGKSGSRKSRSSKSSSQRRAQKRRHHTGTGNIGRFDHVLEVLSLAVLPITLLILLLLIVVNLNGNSWTSFRSDSYSKPSLASANENQHMTHAQFHAAQTNARPRRNA